MSNDAPKDPAQPAAPRYVGNRVQTFVQLALTGAALYGCFRLAAPFLTPVVFAATLAIVFARPHRLIEARLGSPTLAAAASLLLVALIVVAPTMFAAGRLVGEAASGAALVQEQVEAGAWRNLTRAHPWLETVNRWIEEQVDIPALFGMIASWLTNAATSLVRRSAQELLSVLLTFYLLFFLFRDRSQAVRALKTFSPLSEAETEQLLTRIVDTVHATIFGTVAVAALQGFLAGAMFWWLDLPTPLLWGVIMALLAIVPVLGTFVVWVPAAIFLALQGDWVKAAILAGWGGLIVANVDNVVRPVLMGDRLKLHTVPMFVAVIGGLNLFGTAGVVLGPAAVTATALLLDFWRSRANAAADEASSPPQ